MLELKEYQRGALDALARWLETLEDAQRESETTIKLLQQRQIDTPIINELHNYPKSAWQKLKENGGVAATAGEHVDRTDEANRPVPHICFKVPTDGGKTLLAAAALERLPNPENARPTSIFSGFPRKHFFRFALNTLKLARFFTDSQTTSPTYFIEKNNCE